MSKERTYEETHKNFLEDTKKYLESHEDKKISLGHGISLDYLYDAKLHIEELYKFIRNIDPDISRLDDDQKILLDEAIKNSK